MRGRLAENFRLIADSRLRKLFLFPLRHSKEHNVRVSLECRGERPPGLRKVIIHAVSLSSDRRSTWIE